MTNPIRVGMIGAGRIGHTHAENITYRIPEAELVVIEDINRAAAEDVAQRFGVPNVVDSAQGVLLHPDIDAVLICSSTDTHATFTIEAAKAGKHIFCEKPIALDLDVIDEALHAVEDAGVKLQVGFNRRFDPNFKAVHDAVADGQIGQPHILRIASRDPEPPPVEYIKVSGGIFMDMTIHDFDMARYLVGSEVTEVYAAAGVLVDPAIGAAGDVDTAIITLKFANGALGVIDNSRQAVYGYDQRVEVFGSEGGIVVANDKPHTAVLSNRDGVHGAKPLHFFMERYTESFVAEMRAFIAAIQNDTPVPVDGHDGRAPVVIGLAAWKSYRENRPVKTSEIG